MRYIKLPGSTPCLISKDYFTVGYGAGYDLGLEDASKNGILFSLRLQDSIHTLIPGEQKIRLNGRAVGRPSHLTLCDRIEWHDRVALYIDDPLPQIPGKHSETMSPFQVLKKLNTGLGNTDGARDSVHVTLATLLDYAGAESGSFLCESKNGGEWALLAHHGTLDSVERKKVISNTLLEEAIRTQKPVYIESIIGHRWQTQTSILEAKAFSLACVPLVEGEGRVFGALLLYTTTPGRSIDRDRLEALRVIATQTALLHSAYDEIYRVRQENHKLMTEPKSVSDSLVYDRSKVDSPMAGVVERIAKLSQHDLSILIRGETGVGKELVAREIHRKSNRSSAPFIAVNCAAIPPSLMESILFGYAKGAFTGAQKDRSGKFVQADGGTLFLDEIGDLSLDLQSKLLRVLQEKEVEPVGSDRSTKVDIRILSATHQDLEAMAREGNFRSDLYYRLNGATLSVPPLRDRGGNEILILAEHLLRSACGSRSLRFSAAARMGMMQYKWRGNVRELQQTIARAVALCSGTEIQPQDLEIEETIQANEPEAMTSSALEKRISLRASQNQFTQGMIQNILRECDGNRMRAATRLGISERTLYRILAADRNDTVG